MNEKNVEQIWNGKKNRRETFAIILEHIFWCYVTLYMFLM